MASFIAAVFFVLTFFLTASANGQPLPAVTVSAPPAIQQAEQPVLNAASIAQIAQIAAETTGPQLKEIMIQLSSIRGAKTDTNLEAKLDTALTLIQTVATNQYRLPSTNAVISYLAQGPQLFGVDSETSLKIAGSLFGALVFICRYIRNGPAMKWVMAHEATGVQKLVALFGFKKLETRQSLMDLAEQLKPLLAQLPPPNTVATPLQKVSMYQPAAEPTGKQSLQVEPTTVAK